MPTKHETPTAAKIDQTGKLKVNFVKKAISQTKIAAATIPEIPPKSVNVVVSIKNCVKISLRRAPNTIRTPISRVRSTTEASIIFITTTPPTNSAIAVNG